MHRNRYKQSSFFFLLAISTIIVHSGLCSFDDCDVTPEFINQGPFPLGTSWAFSSPTDFLFLTGNFKPTLSLNLYQKQAPASSIMICPCCTATVQVVLLTWASIHTEISEDTPWPLAPFTLETHRPVTKKFHLTEVSPAHTHSNQGMSTLPKELTSASWTLIPS